MTLNEINQFFDIYEKVKSRIGEVASLCTDITPSEIIIGFDKDCYGNILVDVWSRDCGNDSYAIPLEYLAMKNSEIVECEKKKAEKERKRAEREARKEKKRRERKERKEYERLKRSTKGVQSDTKRTKCIIRHQANP